MDRSFLVRGDTKVAELVSHAESLAQSRIGPSHSDSEHSIARNEGAGAASQVDLFENATAALY